MRKINSTKHTAQTLKQRFNNSIFIPEFQRDLVWTLQQKKDLIDTIINDYDIPKLYFALTDDGKHNVIDGQQRLNAVIEFMNGKFKLDNDCTYYFDSSIELGGLLFSELTVQLQRRIEDYEFSVTECEGFTEDEQKELFERLQGGTPLNAPERRRSLPGNMPKTVTDLSKHALFENLNNSDPDKKQILLDKPDRRFSHEDIVAKVMLDIHKNNISTVSAANLKKMYNELKDVTKDDPVYKSTLKIFDFFYSIFKADHYTPKMSQVDFRRLAWIAHTMPKKLNVTKFKKEFADAYIKFDGRRREVLQLLREEEISDTDFEVIVFKEYTEKARAYDASGQEKMDETLRSYIIGEIPDLEPLDKKRVFTENQRRALLFRAQNKCQKCGVAINLNDMEADHITPYSKGGRTVISNGQALCMACNRAKSDNT